MDSLRGFIDQFKNFLEGDGNIFSFDKNLVPAIYVIIFGVVGILIAFIVALIVKNLGRASKFKKQLDDATAYIEATGTIDEENVSGLNQKIQEMPETVSRGWGHFLEQQTGYPSDYITKNEVLEERKGNPNYSSGWGSFNFLSILTILLCWGVSALGHAQKLFEYPAHLEKIAVVLGYILPVFGALTVPLIAYLIFYFIFSSRQKRAYKKLESSFSAFQDALDNNVIIFREINDEFIEENIEEINAAIEDILANKLGQNDILEIVTTPEIDENLIIEEIQDIPLVEEEPWVEEEPITEEDWRGAEPVEEEPVVVEEIAEEIVEEPAVAEPQETAEERERRLGERLVQLVFLADQASKDPNITKEEMAELRAFLAATKDSGDYPSDAEQEIFESCLIILDGAYSVRFASEPEEIVEEPAVEEPQETEAERIEREKGERLVQLVFLADQASRDKEITENDFVELRNFLANVKGSGAYPSDVEQEIFGSCLQILDSAFEVKFGKPSPFVKQESKVEEQTIAKESEDAKEEIIEEEPVVEEPQETIEEEIDTEKSEDLVEETIEEQPVLEDAETEIENEESIAEEEPVVEESQETAEEIVVEESEDLAEETIEEQPVLEDAETEIEAEDSVVEEEATEEKKKKKGLFGRRKK